MVFMCVCVCVYMLLAECVCEVEGCVNIQYISASMGKRGNLVCISDANKAQFDYVAIVIK